MAQSVAIVGSGFIGRGWAVAFARSSYQVRLWDPRKGEAQAASDYVAAMLPEMAEAGLLGGCSVAEVRDRMHVADTLDSAVADAVYIQENAPEVLDTKIRLFEELDARAPAEAVIASSTSSLLPSAFTQTVGGRSRCIVAHPVNPPHLIPLVEIVPAPWTDKATIEKTERMMRELGQSPVIVQREIDGFLLNRLQAAVLDEAFRLVDGGYATAADVDACIRDGLAMRWVFMGPFETIDLNAPGGVRDYVERYEGMYRRITGTMRDSADWSGPALGRIEAERRAQLAVGDLADRQVWRDRQLMKVARFRRATLGNQEN